MLGRIAFQFLAFTLSVFSRYFSIYSEWEINDWLTNCAGLSSWEFERALMQRIGLYLSNCNQKLTISREIVVNYGSMGGYSDYISSCKKKLKVNDNLQCISIISIIVFEICTDK